MEAPSANDRARRRVLVTGATGAVGRYVVDELLREGDSLVVIARDAAVARASLGHSDQIHVIQGELAQGERLAECLPSVDAAILLAAAWDDGPSAWSVNAAGQVALAKGVRARGCRRIVWFGTASVVDREGRALDAAMRHGTAYIASKALARSRLLEALDDSLSIIHPTLVVAGDATHPYSHVARLLPAIVRHAWLVQMVTGEGTVHLVHASDLARMATSLAHADVLDETNREIVAGAPPVSVDALLDLLLERVGRRRRASFDLTPRRIGLLVRALRVQLTDWDAYCLSVRHFLHETARLTVKEGEVPRYPTARAILQAIPR